MFCCNATVLIFHFIALVGCLVSIFTNYWISGANGYHYGLIYNCTKDGCTERSSFLKFNGEDGTYSFFDIIKIHNINLYRVS